MDMQVDKAGEQELPVGELDEPACRAASVRGQYCGWFGGRTASMRPCASTQNRCSSSTTSLPRSGVWKAVPVRARVCAVIGRSRFDWRAPPSPRGPQENSWQTSWPLSFAGD